jgi:hypothetical protein
LLRLLSNKTARNILARLGSSGLAVHPLGLDLSFSRPASSIGNASDMAGHGNICSADAAVSLALDTLLMFGTLG